MRRTAALIVGGGPAGTAAAITLAEAGLRPLLLERNLAPAPIVCGGFLGWDALAALETLGIDPWTLGARPIAQVRIHAGSRTTEARLPGRAAGLSRTTLDRALRTRAVATGARIESATVRSVMGKRVQCADGATIEAERMFVATGKHALRGAPRTGATRDGHVGFRSTLAAMPADAAGAILLHAFRGGYAGVLEQEDGRANLCLSVSRARLVEAGGSIAGLAAALAGEAPTLAALIDDAAPDWAAIAGVPYGWSASDGTDGLYRIGDQGAVIASVVGDGIAMALAGGRMAARALLAGEDAARFQRRLSHRARRPLAVAEAARGLIERPVPAAAALWLAGGVPALLPAIARLTRFGA